MSIFAPSDFCERDAFDGAVAAARRHDWGEAARKFAIAARAPDIEAAARCNLSTAMVQLARHEQAARQLALADRAAPGVARIQDDRARLDAWRDTCRALIGAERLACGAVLGAPLGPHHGAAVHRLTADPALRRFVGLPVLGSVAETRRWLVWQRLRGDRISLGIVHPENGLVGAVSLKTAGDRGRFSYWVGARHRGQGHGRAALRLLAMLARRSGCATLWSEVDADNRPSRGLLEQAGFARRSGRGQDRLHIRTEDLAC